MCVCVCVCVCVCPSVCVCVCDSSTGLDNLAHATVTGLPAETLGPADLKEIPEPGEVLPSYTTTSVDFGREVR